MNGDFVTQDLSSPQTRTRRGYVGSLTQEVKGQSMKLTSDLLLEP